MAAAKNGYAAPTARCEKVIELLDLDGIAGKRKSPVPVLSIFSSLTGWTTQLETALADDKLGLDSAGA